MVSKVKTKSSRKKKSPTRKKSRHFQEPRSYRDIAKSFENVEDILPSMKIALYGKAATGKTTLASTFPKPILVVDCNERGTDSVRDVPGIKVLRAREWQDIDDLFWYLKKEDHGFKTVVLDTVSQVQQICIKKILDDKGKDTEAGALGNWGNMTKQDWGSVATKMKTLIIELADLPIENLIFIAHDRVFNGSDDEDEEAIIAPTVGPQLSPAVASTLNAAVSIIANTFIRETYKKRKPKKGEKKSVTVRKVEYCLRIGPNATYTTKIRKPRNVALPDVLVDTDYEELISYASGDSE